MLDIGSIEDGYAFHITGNAAKNHFAVEAYDAAGEYVDLMVNTLSAYDGITLDMTLSATMLQIQSSGDWTVELLPFSYLDHYDSGDTATGNSDTVFLTDGKSTIAEIAGNDDGNYFAVWAYGSSSSDLLVNEVEPYSGRVMLSGAPYLYVVSAEGDWSIKFN